MEIKFLRLGHANNSSSAHSIIFNPEAKNLSNESTDFGWNEFICGSRYDKGCYAYSIVKESLLKYIDITINYEYIYHGNDIIDYKKFSSHNNKLYEDIIKKKMKWLHDIVHNDEKRNSPIGVEIDHQSNLTLPENRVTGVFDFDFVNKFIGEFVNNDWAILGGNDNGDHAPYEIENIPQETDFLKLWEFLKDSDKGQSMYDKKTDEWWISLDSGPLIRVKF